MSDKLKGYTILVGLIILLPSFFGVDRASPAETALNKEIMISLSYGEQFKESWASGIEAYYFGEPKIGVALFYNVHGSREGHEVLDITEELRLKELSIGFLYRPFGSEDLVAKFGFKDFNYRETAHGEFFSPVTQATDSIAVMSWGDRTSGLWLELSGNRQVLILGKWIKVFGETGVTLAKEKRFVVVDGVKESNWQVIPEFGFGLTLQVISPLRIKFGYYQINLKNTDRFYFIGPVAENSHLSELGVSLEIIYR